MSENTDVNDDQPAGSSGGFRRSRRSMRRAERAAEREAYITGQQPLLTRRELKRLREEAEALRAAVEAGELTVEQAKALQNPLADQPDVGAEPRPVTRAHAALPGPGEFLPREKVVLYWLAQGYSNIEMAIHYSAWC